MTSKPTDFVFINLIFSAVLKHFLKCNIGKANVCKQFEKFLYDLRFVLELKVHLKSNRSNMICVVFSARKKLYLYIYIKISLKPSIIDVIMEVAFNDY